VRKVVVENLPFLLSDTVGFIRKLPTHLVESFKSTLDEVREADILLHVVDISHPNYLEQISVVEETLRELGTGDIPVMMVFNKTDAYTYIPKEEDDLTPVSRENLSLDDLKKEWNGKNREALFISALYRTNMDALKDLLYQKVREIHIKRYPYNDFLY
jgi:GTP-binding protein HflX